MKPFFKRTSKKQMKESAINSKDLLDSTLEATEEEIQTKL